MIEAERDKKKLLPGERAKFAEVIDLSSKGVKIKIDGEDNPRETFYNSTAIVNVGDRVLIDWTGIDVVVTGKLLY